jgi:hypothetical protein
MTMGINSAVAMEEPDVFDLAAEVDAQWEFKFSTEASQRLDDMAQWAANSARRANAAHFSSELHVIESEL